MAWSSLEVSKCLYSECALAESCLESVQQTSLSPRLSNLLDSQICMELFAWNPSWLSILKLSFSQIHLYMTMSGWLERARHKYSLPHVPAHYFSSHSAWRATSACNINCCDCWRMSHTVSWLSSCSNSWRRVKWFKLSKVLIIREFL